MGKEGKIFALSILTLLMISFLISVVSAADPVSDFLSRWSTNTLRDLDAKVLILIMVAVVILIILVSIGINGWYSIPISLIMSLILTSYVAPAAILGIFQSYEPVSLTIATLLPLLIFFGLTYISVMKENRALMALQLITWGVYFVYTIAKLVLPTLLGWLANWGFISLSIIPYFGGVPTEIVSASWFWFATIITIIISGVMTIWNGWFMNFAVRHLAGVDEAKAITKLNKIKRGMKSLEEIGTETSK